MNNEELIEYLENTDELILPVGKTTENRLLDFKEKLDIKSKSGKGKLLKHIIAFANSGGRKLSCIYYGISEKKEKKEFEICGIDVKDVNDSDDIKNIIKDYIYPSINIEIIKIYNDNLFPKKDKVIQVIKIENNKNRPYRFKKTIDRSNSLVEGVKYYRDNHNSCPIPTIEEDKIINKWTLEDSSITKKIIKVVELIGVIAVAVELVSKIDIKIRILYSQYSLTTLICAGILLIIILRLFSRALKEEILEIYKYCGDKLSEEGVGFISYSKSLFKIGFWTIFVFIFEIVFILILISVMEYFLEIPYYGDHQIGFINNALGVIFVALIMSIIMLPFLPIINIIIEILNVFLNRGLQLINRYL